MDQTYFDADINRKKDSKTHSIKWDGYQDSFGDYQIEPEKSIPMWVADMDFLSPKEVIEQIVKRAQHGIYGYTDGVAEDDLYCSVNRWYQRCHGMDLKQEWMVFCPGIVPAINLAIQEFTEEGDGIIIQSPVYYPFRQTIKMNNRVVVDNCLLKEENNYYSFDFAGLEILAQNPKNKMLILSNPHNPVGRVWKKSELERLCTICQENDVILFADEIHCDLLMPGHRFVSAASIYGNSKGIILGHAPSKTFNLAGLQISVISIPDSDMRKRFTSRYRLNGLPSENVFSMVAGIAAYEHGDLYADLLVDYLQKNIDFAKEYANKHIPGLRFYKPEGTYLVWMDFSGTGKNPEEITRLLLEKARVIGDPGEWFGPGGSGFMRFNFACPRTRIKEAMERIGSAF